MRVCVCVQACAHGCIMYMSGHTYKTWSGLFVQISLIELFLIRLITKDCY